MQEVLVSEPMFPEPLRYLWNWFNEILYGMQANGMVLPIITWEALDCWARLTRHELAPHEAETLVKLSNSRVLIMAEKAEKKSNAA